VTLAHEAEFKGNLYQRNRCFFKQETGPLNSAQHDEAVRAATHRLPEEPGELMSSDADLICEIADSNARRHRAINCIESIPNLACRQFALHLSQTWLRAPTPNQMPDQDDAHSLDQEWVAYPALQEFAP
jgi:hypothetical protein